MSRSTNTDGLFQQYTFALYVAGSKYTHNTCVIRNCNSEMFNRITSRNGGTENRNLIRFDMHSI